ncbi:MAG TPA: PadR family transcriptional regulator [Vicinamibacterales bacterium]
MSVEEKFAAIRKGLLEYLILKIVAAEKVYAADILKRLAATDFSTQEGTLYPLLSKMRRDGLLDYEWQESDAGPPRKYYELTARGRAQLADLNEYWKGLNATIAQLGK